MLGILFDRAVRGEVAHVGDVVHRFGGPLLRLLIQLIDPVLTVHIATEIGQYLIVVAEVNQRIHQVTVTPRLARAEHAGGDLRQHLAQLFILLVVVARAVALTAQRLHLFSRVAKDKEVIRPHVFLHLHVSPVQRTDG